MKLFSTKRVPPNGPVEKFVIYRSGIARDGRKISNADVIEAYKNTQTYVLPFGIEIPLKKGHKDESQEYKGEILSVKLQKFGRKNTKSFRYQIVAEVLFTQASYDLLSGSSFTGLSPEIALVGYHDDGSENGEKYGQHIAGLALLGTEPAAIPGLLTARFENDPAVYYYSFVPGNSKKKNYTKETQMEKDNFQVPEDVMSALGTITDFIASLATEEVTEEEEATVEENAADDTSVENFELETAKKEIAELKSKLEATATEKDVETQFSLLHRAGKVREADKKIFSLLVKTAGMDLALQEYNARPSVKTPPQTAKAVTQTAKPKEEDGHLKYQPKWEKHYTKIFPNDPKQVKEYAEHSAKQQFSMNGGAK